MNKKKFRFEPKQTETRSVSRLFPFVSWNPKKKFSGLFRCFEPISKQPKRTELFRNEPKQSGIFWMNIHPKTLFLLMWLKLLNSFLKKIKISVSWLKNSLSCFILVYLTVWNWNHNETHFLKSLSMSQYTNFPWLTCFKEEKVRKINS